MNFCSSYQFFFRTETSKALVIHGSTMFRFKSFHRKTIVIEQRVFVQEIVIRNIGSLSSKSAGQLT